MSVFFIDDNRNAWPIVVSEAKACHSLHNLTNSSVKLTCLACLPAICYQSSLFGMGTPCQIDVKLAKVEGRKNATIKDRNGSSYKAPVYTVSTKQNLHSTAILKIEEREQRACTSCKKGDQCLTRSMFVNDRMEKMCVDK